jgi:hypothetical protein
MMMRRTNNRTSSSPQFPTNSNDAYKILQWNVRNIHSRSLDLVSILHSKFCSISLLSETWLRPGQKYSLPAYNLIRSDRVDGYGDVAITIHQSIYIKEIPIDVPFRNNLLLQSINLVGIKSFMKQIPCFKLPAFNLLSIHRKLLFNSWQSKWSSLPPNFAS